MKLNDFFLHGTNGSSAWNTGGNIQLGSDLRGEAAPTWFNSANPYFGYWNALLPWFVVWDGPNHTAGTLNLGLWVKRHELYVAGVNNTWQQRQISSDMWLDFYAAGLEGGQAPSQGDQYTHPEGGRVLRINKGGMVAHGGTGFVAVTGSDVRKVHTRLVCSLIRYDNFQPQIEFNLAEYGIQCGCDAYPTVGMSTSAFNPAGYAIASGASRFRRVPQQVGQIVGASIRGAEMTVSFTNLASTYSVDNSSKAGKQSYFVMSDAAFLANLPPGVILTGTTPPPPPPPSTGFSFGPMTMAGDSLFRGNTFDLPFFFSPNQKLDQLLTAGGYAHGWVGSRPVDQGQTATPGNFPTSSQGGWTVQDLINDLPNIDAAAPDTIITSYGTNGLDIAAAKTPEFLDGLRARFPEANKRIYVCCPYNPGWFDTAQFNALRSAMVTWCAGGTARYFIDLNDVAPLTTSDGTHWTQADADKVATLIYNKMVASIAVTPPPPGPTPPPPPPPPSPPPPPPVVQGRKTIWLAGNAIGSVEDGTITNPINTVTKLQAAITTYGPTGIDIKMKSTGIWTGILPSEVAHYVGATLMGDDWLSALGHFEGGVLKTDWTTQTGAPGGKQLWKCTSLINNQLGTGNLQPGAVSVDDAIVAQRRWRGTLGATIPFMDDFDLCSAYDIANNIMYLMLPTGTNPNNVVTMVGQYGDCFQNQAFAAGGNKRTGIILQHLRFKRFSRTAVRLANLPGIYASNIYGKHIGGFYSTSLFSNDLLSLDGGCDKFVVSALKGDGIGASVFTSRVSAPFPNQPGGTASNITGSHVGLAVVGAALDSVDGCSMDDLLFEDISGTQIGDFTAAGMRPDYVSGGLVAAISTSATGTSHMYSPVFRRVVAVDAPIGFIDVANITAGTKVFYEACQGKVNPALTIDAAVNFSHLQSGTGVDQLSFRACAFQGYQSGIKNEGGQHSFAVEVSNCTFLDHDVAAINMNGVPNTTLTVRNNVAHNSVLLVRAANGAGSTIDNQGGNYVTTGTALGMTAHANDDVNQATPAWAGSAVGKPPNASGLYSGGVSLGSIVLRDRIGQLFQAPWAQGAYAAYNASDGITGGTIPVPGGSSGVSVWEDYLTPGGFIAYLAEQTVGDSQITGITNVPASLSIFVNQIYYLTPTVTGTGDYNQSLTYELLEGTAVTVQQNGQIKGLAVGQSKIRIKSTQAPSVFVDIVINITNFNEWPIVASPTPLNLTLIGGPQTIKITANNRPQAGVFAISTNSLIVKTAEKSAFDGTILVTPLSVGNCTVMVTKVSRAGGQQTLEVPVLVTLGTDEGDVTEINTEDAVISVNAPFYQMILDDQNGAAIARRIDVTVDRPYVRTANALVNGALNIYPLGVGICTMRLELVNSAGRLITTSVRIEVIPIGGVATPAPPPPPPIGNPDGTTT